MILTKRKYSLTDQLILYIRCVPAHGSVFIAEKIISAFMPALGVLLTANFVDTGLAIIRGGKPVTDIYLPITLLILMMVYSQLVGFLVGFVQVRAGNRLRIILRNETLAKRARLSYKHIENQETQDLINRTCGSIEDRVGGSFNNIVSFVNLIIQVLSIMSIIFVQVWWAALVIIVICVPLFVIGSKAGKKSYEADREVTKIVRKYGYLAGVMSGRDSIEERYIFGYAPKLNALYHDEYEKARVFKKKVDKKNYVRMKAGGVITALVSSFIVLVLLHPTLDGIITLGLFTSLVSAVFGLAQQMSWGLSWMLKEITNNNEFMKDLTKFMELDEEEGAELLPSYPPVVFESVEFRNVSFRYPGTEPYILKDISFKLESGRHYAVVGINGAGKTTITKLITGLYSDFEGEILINGKSIRDYTQAQLKSMTCVVYQDFARYYISFKDNIALGNINNPDDRESFGKSVNLLKLDGVIDKLPAGIETPLGKIKDDGVDLSGGEWQRVAMARAIVSPATLRILDEPTAALDPISESRVYEQFEQISRGCATIFISHRLGSTKLADEILVIGEGTILEQGTHAELMAKNGLYAEMFISQSEWYKGETSSETSEEGVLARV